MSHLHGRRRGPERGSGASSKNPAGISGAALQRLDAVVTRRNAGFQAETPARAGNGTKNGLTLQAGCSAIFRAGSQERARIAGSPGRRAGNFRPFLGFPTAFPNFRGISGEFSAASDVSR
jgi:hypothetical protein